MIIIISGTSSSGKSTVSEALKRKFGDGWLLFSTDGYLSMLGEKFANLHPGNQEVCIPNDVCYAKKHEDNTYEIISGKSCSKLYSTIPQVLNILAEAGFNIIVDSFISTKEEFYSYKQSLDKHGLLTVFLDASSKILKQRESARLDRLKGSAIHWLRQINCKDEYDLIIDSGTNSIDSVVATILHVYSKS